MYQMNGIPNANYAELVFKGPVEGIPITECAYWVVEQEEDVDYSWQKEVLINGSFRILSIEDVDDPRTPKLKKRYILTPARKLKNYHETKNASRKRGETSSESCKK